MGQIRVQLFVLVLSLAVPAWAGAQNETGERELSYPEYIVVRGLAAQNFEIRRLSESCSPWCADGAEIGLAIKVIGKTNTNAGAIAQLDLMAMKLDGADAETADCYALSNWKQLSSALKHWSPQAAVRRCEEKFYEAKKTYWSKMDQIGPSVSCNNIDAVMKKLSSIQMGKRSNLKNLICY